MIDLKAIEHLLPEEIKSSTLIWKYIDNYPMYICSEYGDIVSLEKTIIRYGKSEIKKAFILTQSTNNYGYKFVGLHNKGNKKFKQIHIIVAECFIGKIEKGKVVDHKDNIKLNNHYTNLQITTTRHNTSKDRKNKSSIFTGVSWDPLTNKWRASIYVNGKIERLGSFTNEQKASEAYNKRKSLLP